MGGGVMENIDNGVFCFFDSVFIENGFPEVEEIILMIITILIFIVEQLRLIHIQ